MPVAVDPPSPATLRQIAEGIATNLRPVRPVAPARYFFAAFVGIFVSIVALGVYRMGAFAIAVMTPLQTAAILSALAVSTGLLAYSLVHQMIPGSRHRISPRLLPVGIAISLTIVIAVLFQFQHEQNFWGNAWPCIRAGTPIGVLAAVPFWLMLAPRRHPFSEHDRSGNRAVRGVGWDQCAGDSLPQPGCMAHSDIAPRRSNAVRFGRPYRRIGGRSR